MRLFQKNTSAAEFEARMKEDKKLWRKAALLIVDYTDPDTLTRGVKKLGYDLSVAEIAEAVRAATAYIQEKNRA